MYKTFQVLSVALAVLHAGQTGAQTERSATDVTALAIQEALKQAPKDSVSDTPMRVVDVGGYNVGVYLVYRPKSTVQMPALHETKVVEVLYILEGAGTLVTGGTLTGQSRRSAASNSPLAAVNTVTGTRIEGGVSRRVSKGDVVVIPGYTPHQFTDAESDITYLIIRSDPEGKLPLK
jgi:mannose-6-phosphate isomerase-like protein (cupin superfamily)